MLTAQQQDQQLPPPASCPKDCSVGPTEIELSDSSTFVSWGSAGNRLSHEGPATDDATVLAQRECPPPSENAKKRKHCGGDNSNESSNETGTAAPEPTTEQAPPTADGDNRNSSTSSNNSTSSFRHAIGTFLSSGCCVIDRPVLPPQFVERCLDRARSDHGFLEGLMKKERERILGNNSSRNNRDDDWQHNRHHRMAALTRQDYAEWVARDGGRVDIRYNLNEHPYNCGGLIYNSIVFPFVKALLNGVSSNGSSNDDDDNNSNSNSNAEDEEEEEPVQLLYAGVMWGMPVVGDGNKNKNNNNNNGSGDPSSLRCHQHHQKWHADGGHLFSEGQLPVGLTLPPHCINVFYPLVDLTENNGPTEFRIGSHRRKGKDATTNDGSTKGGIVEFPLLCPAGGAVIFDYRIQHRGRANLVVPDPSSSSTNNTKTGVGAAKGPATTENARPVLYLAYAKTYFKDHGNTRSGRRLVPNGDSSPWTTRTLSGRVVPYGKGFENYASAGDQPNKDGNNTDTELSSKTNGNGNLIGNETANVNANDFVGERWIMFQMTLELPDGKSEILRVHKGDVAVEVAQQFCFKHGIQDDFVSILTQTIQTQMDQCC